MMSDNPPKQLKLDEKDKPFIIAMMFIVGFFALIFVGAYGAFMNISAVGAYIDKVLVGVAGIVGTVVGYYFKSKS